MPFRRGHSDQLSVSSISECIESTFAALQQGLEPIPMLAKSVGLPEFLHGGFVFEEGDEDCMATILGDVKARAA